MLFFLWVNVSLYIFIKIHIMKAPFIFFIIFFSTLVFVGFSQCNTPKKAMKITKTITLQERNATQVYYQHWVAGVQGGGSGVNLVISKKVLDNIKPIKIYFRNKTALVEEKQFDYVARYKGTVNQINDYNMSANPKEEYGNTAAKNTENFPFQLQENEAIISYLQNNTTKYLKLTNITEKEMLAYPSAPPQNR